LTEVRKLCSDLHTVHLRLLQSGCQEMTTTFLLVFTRGICQFRKSSTTSLHSQTQSRSSLGRISTRRNGVHSTLLWRTWVTMDPCISLLTDDGLGVQYHICRFWQINFPRAVFDSRVLKRYQCKPRLYYQWSCLGQWHRLWHLAWHRHRSSFATPRSSCLGSWLHHRSSNQLSSTIELFSECTQPIL